MFCKIPVKSSFFLYIDFTKDLKWVISETISINDFLSCKGFGLLHGCGISLGRKRVILIGGHHTKEDSNGEYDIPINFPINDIVVQGDILNQSSWKFMQNVPFIKVHFGKCSRKYFPIIFDYFHRLIELQEMSFTIVDWQYRKTIQTSFLWLLPKLKMGNFGKNN